MSFVIELFAKAARTRRAAAVQRAGLEPARPPALGIDDFQANRSPDKRNRTTPLKGLFTRAKVGFYHDGRFTTLADVINRNDEHLSTGLDDAEKAELVQYLKSMRGRTAFSTRAADAKPLLIRCALKNLTARNAMLRPKPLIPAVNQEIGLVRMKFNSNSTRKEAGLQRDYEESKGKRL